MNEPLENQLETLREPRMPADVEARIRRRIAAERLNPRRPRWRNRLWNGSYLQLAALALLLALAGWVVTTQVYPVLRSAWDRYCATTENAPAKRSP